MYSILVLDFKIPRALMPLQYVLFYKNARTSTFYSVPQHDDFGLLGGRVTAFFLSNFTFQIQNFIYIFRPLKFVM